MVPLRAAVAYCGGSRGASPGGGAFRRCGERLNAGASPSPAACLLGGLPGPATRALWVRMCECGGPALSPCLSAGGVAFYRCEGCPVTSAVPPSATLPPGRAVRVSWARQVRAWGPSTGPTPFTAVRGVWSGASPPPVARRLGGLSGPATHVLWAGVCGCWGPVLPPWVARPVGAACRGVRGGPSPEGGGLPAL